MIKVVISYCSSLLCSPSLASFPYFIGDNLRDTNKFTFKSKTRATVAYSSQSPSGTPYMYVHCVALACMHSVQGTCSQTLQGNRVHMYYSYSYIHTAPSRSTRTQSFRDSVPQGMQNSHRMREGTVNDDLIVADVTSTHSADVPPPKPPASSPRDTESLLSPVHSVTCQNWQFLAVTVQ